MKTPLKLWYAIALGGILLFLSSFEVSHEPVNADLREALELTQRDFRHDLDEFHEVLGEYNRMAADPSVPTAALQSVHGTCRRAYKKIEYLVAYAQPATVARHINGAPLPKTEPGVPEIVVIPPGGLQTLDELVSEEEVDRSAIKSTIEKLRGDFDYLYRQMKGLRLQHRHVFESLQEQAIRVFTLGVTGFDTPASGAALEEAAVNFRRMSRTYGYYSASVADRNDAVGNSIVAALQRGEEMLAAGDFANFDRLTFLREVINPLTENIPQAQRLLEIESAADYGTLPTPRNLGPVKLFDEDFLDAAYYGNFDAAADPAARLALGELLFFDPVLSKDLTLSCASCHQPDLAFTDGYAKSLSGDGATSLSRNSPTLINSIFAEKYFYDLREEFLERQMKHVVRDAHEFNTDFISIENRLKESTEYRRLFEQAYADQSKYALSRWSISDALSRYVASLTALNSPFDRYARGEETALPASVQRGFNLFMGKAACGTCHFAPTFSGLVPPYYSESESEVLGVPAAAIWENATLDPDRGRSANSRPADEVYFNQFAFKTPTVRNVSVTAPYMHNGVYETLEEVMDFYNRGGGAGIGITIEHQTLPFDSLSLASSEISDIISFMGSLEDYTSLRGVPGRLPVFEGRPAWGGDASRSFWFLRR